MGQQRISYSLHGHGLRDIHLDRGSTRYICGTLAANLIGVALASALLVLMERRGITELRHLLLPGFCAGMTTFSAVTVQVVEPASGGALFLAENVLLSLLIVLTVLPLSRRLIPVRK